VVGAEGVEEGVEVRVGGRGEVWEDVWKLLLQVSLEVTRYIS